MIQPNLYFTGTIDDLLKDYENASIDEINKVGDKNEILNHDEIVALLMDDYKLSRNEAEIRATEIQCEELERISNELVNKGYTVQIDNTFGYTLTIWPPSKKDFDHVHYDGDTLVDALLQCKKKLLDNK